ncbi:MAG: hypothetical protein M1814_005273 [Vezdaea aestivalis]|nr:MAG: hypothetical protein M1814_005273 [Vezdaea aestivalis]
MASSSLDSGIRPFLESSFDPIEYLNSTLPALSSAASPAKGNARAIPLVELNTETQSLVSQLGAQTARQLDILTQLTDEILRGGSRLAYEVEVLRGDTATLAETVKEDLSSEIEVFVPKEEAGKMNDTTPNGTSSAEDGVAGHKVTSQDAGPDAQSFGPPAMSQLRTLSLVRNRLDMVIKVFGDAMDWTLPPSEVSMASSFISVSAPEPRSDSHSREEKGQQVSKKLRSEIAMLLNDGSRSPAENVQAAMKRVGELSVLARVWKGTAEEKSRLKFVESLSKIIEDKQRQNEKELAQSQRKIDRAATASPRKSVSTIRSGTPDSSARDGGYGFINQLQKMRGGL